jgi:winged helix DNA-binding protein
VAGLALPLARRRATAQLLRRPPGLSPTAIVRALLAVQAQDFQSARLALRARGERLAAALVDAALTDERSLVVAWLGRGTLHLVCREDYPWLLALTAPTRFANNRRRLGQEGVSPGDAERAVGVIERGLADEGALTRPDLAERLDARGIRTEGQATAHC